MKELRTEIIINATPTKIWLALIDIDNYPQWNPFIKSIKGVLEQGQKIVVRIEPPGAMGMTLKPNVLVVNKEKEFRWLGHLLIPGLFDGEHIFEITANTDGTSTFVQREEFNGILIPLFSKMLDINTKKGFESMNVKLKEICEL